MSTEAICDDDLVLMYREGDAEAFEVIFARHHASVYGFAWTMLRDAAAAEDILQETFLAVARAARSYAPHGRFRAWLMRIVRNRCLNRLEVLRSAAAYRPPQTLPADRPDGSPGPAGTALAREQRQVVRAALADLPDRQREAVALYALEGMKYREVADVMAMPVNTVKTLIHRGRASLAAALEPYIREDLP